MKKSFADIVESLESEQKAKVAGKLPGWAAAGDIVVPSKLALEQCSSSATAAYKAQLVDAHYVRPGTVCDLTGGLGVDSAALSSVCDRLHYFERSAELCSAASVNFNKLGISNIEIHNEDSRPEMSLPHGDLIYADPARRDSVGKKVFLLEDCSPDILTMLPMLFEKAPVLLFKLSPMADIGMLASRFGSHLKEVHIVSLGGEVKELLCLLERSWSDGYKIIVAELSKNTNPVGNFHSEFSGIEDKICDGKNKVEKSKIAVQEPSNSSNKDIICDDKCRTEQKSNNDEPKNIFCFTPSEAENATVEYASEIEPGQHLLEPSSALLKSGAFKLICNKFGICKLDVSTHLYISDKPIDSSFFKDYPIREIVDFGNAGIKDVASRFPKAELTARNLPITTDALRKKMKLSSGGDTHIFACTTLSRGKVLIVCSLPL